uniref:FAD-dependent oxidoreductase n=1 Tax=Enterobacter hormaechei TaxID=158836 RepID=UPI002931DE03
VVLPPMRGGMPAWTSLTPAALCDLIQFRRFLKPIPSWLQRHDTTITIAEYIDRQRLSRRFTDGFLYPLLLALWCVEPEEFRGFAAYNTLFYLGETLTDGFHPPTQLEIEGGMKSYIDALVRSLDRAELRVNAGVRSITREGDAFAVEDVTGFRRTVDHVV